MLAIAVIAIFAAVFGNIVGYFVGSAMTLRQCHREGEDGLIEELKPRAETLRFPLKASINRFDVATNYDQTRVRRI